MKTVGIIGYGRFGVLLARLFKDEFSVSIVEADMERVNAATRDSVRVVELKDIGSLDIVIFAVPISHIESVIQLASEFITSDQLVIDICSVKVYPTRLMKKYVGSSQILAMHPMFGPDSARSGLTGLQVALCPITIGDENLQMITNVWQRLGATPFLTTPEAHDKDSVYSQAFTYSVAKIILGVDTSKVKLTTRSFKAITEVARLSANDNEQLFHDMLYYNPYYKEMKAELFDAIRLTQSRLDEIEHEQDDAKLFA